MQTRMFSVVVMAGIAMGCVAQPKTAKPKPYAWTEKVDWEMMTWPEIKDAIDHGKTTALIYNGGTETRGPQAVVGGHTFVAHAKNIEIARRLGNAIAAPVMPFSPNNAFSALPGTIGVSVATFKQVNKEVAEQMVRNGFKNVVLMGDHGGGQKELKEVAEELTAQYASQGVKVVYCDDVYKKSNADFDAYLAAHEYAPGGHASINDTSEMMYVEPKKDEWVRRDQLKNAVGAPKHKKLSEMTAEEAKELNGVSGDGRKSNEAVGKIGYDIHVDEAVAQIHSLLGESAPAK